MREIPIGVSGIYTQKVVPADLANQFKDTMLPILGVIGSIASLGLLIDRYSRND